jgi:hypothetical protein
MADGLAKLEASSLCFCPVLEPMFKCFAGESRVLAYLHNY